MDFSALSPWRRSTFCCAMAQRNINHILLFCEIQEQDSSPCTKLFSKTWAFLSGDLQSINNLERFFNDFDDWQTLLLKDQDSFGAEVAQQACQSLYAASYALLDDSANDCELVQLSQQQLINNMADMGNDPEGSLAGRQQTFEGELIELIQGKGSQKEIVLAVKKLASSEDESSLGITIE